ncbi:uncharacterized protein [Misgurnus anguillicaudatus]
MLFEEWTHTLQCTLKFWGIVRNYQNHMARYISSGPAECLTALAVADSRTVNRPAVGRNGRRVGPPEEWARPPEKRARPAEDRVRAGLPEERTQVGPAEEQPMLRPAEEWSMGGLAKQRQRAGLATAANHRELLNLTSLLDISLDASKGCAYLERKRFVHK